MTEPVDARWFVRISRKSPHRLIDRALRRRMPLTRWILSDCKGDRLDDGRWRMQFGLEKLTLDNRYYARMSFVDTARLLGLILFGRRER